MKVEDGFKYAKDVSRGDIVACTWIVLACDRFLNDLDRTDVPWHFDYEKADRILRWFEMAVRHVKGSLAGKPLVLEPWQIFIMINVFGFVNKKTGFRRFNNVLDFEARKNGKSVKASGIATYHILADGEQGAEAFSLASKQDQAKIVWNDAVQMVTKMPEKIKAKFKHRTNVLSVPESYSFYKPLGRDSKSLDGLNVSLAIFDEWASVGDRNLEEVITSSQGSREQYLNYYITTAQFDKTSSFYDSYLYCKRILSGDIVDDTWFAAIYELDEGDDWKDESVWIKANPNIDVSISRDFLRKQVNMATQIPSKQNNFLVKHMNMWTSSSLAWLPNEYWRQSIVTEPNYGNDTYVGVDLGKVSDLTALSFAHKRVEDGVNKYYCEFYSFLPELALENAPKHVKPLYQSAIDRGVLMLTEGNATDYRYIHDFLNKKQKEYNIREILYDKWGSTQLVTELALEGAPVIEIGQGMGSLSPACKDTERLIREGCVEHLDDPFFEWQFNNCTVFTDVNENIKVRKGDDPSLKVDNIVALIFALGRGEINKSSAPAISFI